MIYSKNEAFHDDVKYHEKFRFLNKSYFNNSLSFIILKMLFILLCCSQIVTLSDQLLTS